MNTPQAQTVIVTVGLGVLGLAVVDAGQRGAKPTTTRVLGTALATVALSAAANVAPEIAGPLALLWGLSAVMVAGAGPLKAITNATSSKPPATASGPARTYFV